MHCSNGMRQRLEYLYRKCGRIILGQAHSRDDTKIFLQLNVLPLRLLFQLRGASLMYRIICLQSVPLFDGYFVFSRSIRRPLDLSLPSVSSDCARRSLRFWGAKLWNSIPMHIRNATTLPQFVRVYETYLKSRINDVSLESYNLYAFV